MPTQRVVLCLLFSVCICICGCGKAPTRSRIPVSGSVTFDGKPVETGMIVFKDTVNEALAPDGGNVVNGIYRVEVQPGKKRVEILASRPIANEGPVRPDRAQFAITPVEQYLPEAYNVKSILTAEVDPSGTNEFDFSLKPAPPSGQ